MIIKVPASQIERYAGANCGARLMRIMMRKAALPIGIIGAAILSIPAYASSRLPIPPTTQQFSSFQACVAALEGFSKEDRARVVAKTRDTNGDTREIDLDTKGIEHLAAAHARYEATIWAHYGRFDAKLGGTETSHSFEQRLRECKGSTLSISGENGFTLSTFTP